MLKKNLIFNHLYSMWTNVSGGQWWSSRVWWKVGGTQWFLRSFSPLKPCFLNPPLVTLPKSSLSSGFGWFCLFPHASIHSFEWGGLTKNALLVHCNWGMMGFVSAPFFMSLAECWCCIKMSLSGWMALKEKGAAEFPAGRSILRSPGSSRKKSVGIKKCF